MSRLVDKPDKEKDNDEEIPAQESPNPILRHRPKTRTSPPSAHARGDWPCMQAGSSLPQLVLTSQKKKKKKTRIIIHYGRRRRRRRRNTLLVLLLYCCCCCSSSSASLFLLQNYRSRANTAPRKRQKQQCQKKPSSWTQYPFFPPTQTRTKKFTNLPYKILLTLQTGYVLQPRKRERDRETERARTRR